MLLNTGRDIRSITYVFSRVFLCPPTLRILLICTCLISRNGLSAQQVETVTTGSVAYSTPFRLAFVRNDPETGFDYSTFESLRQYLSKDADVQRAMIAASIDEILLQSYDSHRLLLEALDAEQPDLALCSALDYAYLRGDYEPVLQLRFPGDSYRSGTGARVWHNGAIFVGSTSPLFHMNLQDALRALPQYLDRHSIAMVGGNSASGYLYPYLTLAQRATSATTPNFSIAFWDSSEEVAKAVFSGIHDIGACDATVLENVAKDTGLSDTTMVYRVLLRTSPVPRDPWVLHRRWTGQGNFLAARHPNSELGRVVIRKLQIYFDTNPNLPNVEKSTPEAFHEVQGNRRRFEQLHSQDPTGRTVAP